MTSARSRRYPGRRSVRSWQLTALVGVVGALALAGCGSSSSSSTSIGGQQRRHAVGQRLGHVGHDRVVGEPHRHQRAPTPGRC